MLYPTWVHWTLESMRRCEAHALSHLGALPLGFHLYALLC